MPGTRYGKCPALDKCNTWQDHLAKFQDTDVSLQSMVVRHWPAMSLTPLSILAITLYAFSATLLAAPITGCPYTLRRTGLMTGALAVCLHAAALLTTHGGQLDLHFFAALSLVGCVVTALTLLLNLVRPVTGLSLIVFPLTALLLLMDMVLAPPTQPQAMDWQIVLHAGIALLTYSLLSIAALLAILLAIQERALRSHHPGRLLHALPPLTQTESLLFRLLRAGFAGLSLTLLTGALFVHNIARQHLSCTIVLSSLAWVIFAALLWGRWRYGWRGRRAMRLTLLGMATLALGFFGSKFILELVRQHMP